MPKDIFDEMEDSWASPVVARTEVGKFSGGMMSSKHLANLDCQGAGPPRVTCGRKVGYPVDSLIAWMRARSGN
jgi:hypothetical protein